MGDSDPKSCGAKPLLPFRNTQKDRAYFLKENKQATEVTISYTWAPDENTKPH